MLGTTVHYGVIKIVNDFSRILPDVLEPESGKSLSLNKQNIVLVCTLEYFQLCKEPFRKALDGRLDSMLLEIWQILKHSVSACRHIKTLNQE